MASSESKEVARKLFEEVWNQGDFSRAGSLFADGYSAHIPLIGKVDRRGLERAVQLFRRAFPDLHFEIKDTVVEGSKVAIHWMSSGTSRGEFLGYPPNGKFATVHGLSVIELEGGRIVRDWSEYDVMELLQALGLKPPLAASSGAQELPQAEAPH